MGDYGDNPDPKEERYERYLAGRIYWQKKAENKRKKRLPDSIYIRFYKEGKNLSSDIGKDIQEKERLFYKYLPGRFGMYGKQPIDKLEGLQKGRLFNKLMGYCERRLGRRLNQ